MHDPKRDISTGRKAAYYTGLGMIVIGFLLFMSVFVTGITSFANQGPFQDFGNSMASMGARAVTGMLLMIGGGILMNVGARGMAGSGMILDPRRTRRDLEPWGRAAGGLLGDAFDEAGLNTGKDEHGQDLPFDEKLRRLDALRKEGLITEQEYQAKRTEFINERW